MGDNQELLPPQELVHVDAEVFSSGNVLCNSEVAYLLDQYRQGRMGSNPNFQLPPAVKKTKDYVDKFASATNEETIKNIRFNVFQNYPVKQYEYAVIVNLMPETAEEACALVPSLKDPERFPEDKLTQLLSELAMQRQYQ